MLDRDRAEALFLEHLGWIDRAAFIACARHGVSGAEAEDFASWMRMKLMEDDYAVLRGFRGEAGLKTYLATVVARNFFSYVRMHRGEWRSSAAAERLDPPARDLERLVHRDGYTVQQAGEVLRTAGLTTLSDAELARLLGDLPVRSPLRPVELQWDEVLNATPGGSHADERVVAAESETRRTEIMNALRWALGELEPEDRLIARMHFGEGRTIAQVARALNLDQKPLYRRVQRLRTRLRTLLETAGLREEDVQGPLFEPESS
ncbi:MAG TPA: sigma-70 family RNA polymerase sigma factor [Longimicrobium sp.]